MKTHFFLISAILLFIIPLCGQSSPMNSLEQSNNGWSLDSFNNNTHTFYEELEIFHDKNGNTTFEEVQNFDSLFTTNTTSENFQPDDVYWSKITLRGHSEKTANYLFGSLTFENDNYAFQIDHGKGWQYNDAWLVHEDGSIESQQSGFGIPKQEKSVPSVANFARFEIKQNEKVILYSRFQGAMKDKKRTPQKITFSLLNEDMFPGYIEGYPFKKHFRSSSSLVPFKFNLIKNHELYIDPSGKATIDNIAKNWNQLDTKDVYNTSHVPNQIYWIKTRFYGSAYFNGEQILSIPHNMMFSFDYVDAYIRDGKGGYQHQRTGDEVPLQERPYNFWGNFIKLEISPTDTVDLYLRMEGVDPQYLSHQVLLSHVDPSSLFPHQVNEAWKNGLFYGILGIQCIFFLLLFLIERERIHLYFTLSILGMFSWMAFVADNIMNFVPFPMGRDFHLFLFLFGLFLSSYGSLKFTETYFNYSKTSFLSKWLLPIYFFVSAIIHLNAYLQWEISPNHDSTVDITYLMVLLIQLLFAVILFTIAIITKRQKNVSKKIFILAFLPLLLVGIFVAGNAIRKNFFGENLLFNLDLPALQDIFKIAVAALLTLLAISIGNRTNLLKAEKETALQKNLADQKRINKAISRFVPNEFLNALGKSSITEVALGDNIEKEVTVFFADIRNFTALSELMTPEENFQFVNVFNNRTGPIIQRNNGFINQYLGDGIMAIFPDSPADTLRAAIEMQQALHIYNKQQVQKGQTPIKVGMGMHTGSLIMGITGDEHRLDATTISDSVNSASRIENLTKHYGNSILLSEVSLKKLDNPEEFHIRYLGQVQVKGKQNLLKIYECFDGDVTEMFELKLATLAKFNTGIKHYFNQSFSKAVLDFEKVVKHNPKDKTATLFLHKAKQLEKVGIEENWTGIEMMGEK